MKVGTTVLYLALPTIALIWPQGSLSALQNVPESPIPPDKSPPLTQDLKQDLTQTPTQVLKAPNNRRI